MTRQEIYDVILAEAYQTVREQGFMFAPLAEKQLKELIYTGVFYTMTDGEILDERKIEEAQTNIRLICNELCRHSRVRQSGRIVEVRTFTEVRFRFCPRYPFC